MVLAAMVAFVVPGVIRIQASKAVEAVTGRRLTIGALSINPFTWSTEFSDVSISEPGRKQVFASLRKARVAVSPSSLWQGAPILSHVRLDSPHFNVVRTGPDTYNLSDLIQYLKIPPLSLNDVRVSNGTIDFFDQTRARAERHTLRDAELVVPFLTTIPKFANEFGYPHFSAVIDGALLVIEGQIRGLMKTVEATAQVDLKNLSLPYYLSYLPARISVQMESGKVAAQGTVTYRIAANTGPNARWDGNLVITEIKASDQQGQIHVDIGEIAIRSRLILGEKTGLVFDDGAVEVRNFSAPFGEGNALTLARLSIQGTTFAAKENRMHMAGVLVEKGRIQLSRSQNGTFSHMPLLKTVGRELTRIKPLPAVRMDELVLTDGALLFTDHAVPGTFRATVGDMELRVTDLSSDPGLVTDVRLQAILQKNAHLRITGKGAPLRKPASADFGLSLDRLDLNTVTPYSRIYLGLEIDRGALTINSRARLDQGTLAAENLIRVEHLTFGQSVNSDKATSLPVRLLSDILRDKNGDIVLDIPLSANIDDENFAGSIVRQVAKDVIFPPLQSVAFAECSTDLSPDAQGRLRKLAVALRERPMLKINVIGYVDRESDGKACRERDARNNAPSRALIGDARMKLLAEGRAATVRNFLVGQGQVDIDRVVARILDIDATPRQQDDQQARVEFSAAGD